MFKAASPTTDLTEAPASRVKAQCEIGQSWVLCPQGLVGLFFFMAIAAPLTPKPLLFQWSQRESSQRIWVDNTPAEDKHLSSHI